jgi:DNA-directed RNA polymerase subunit RPC12/RpoP
MNESPRWIVKCADCSLVLNEPYDMLLGTRAGCPHCGSRARSMRWTGPNAGHILISEKVQRKPGQKRSPSESIKGDIYSVAKGKMLRIHRIIDRRRNFYYEKVHDPDTREVLREVEEPLTEHRGHGSAKPRDTN